MSDSHRPGTFDAIVGQEETKRLLTLKIKAFKKTNSSVGHLLFLGPPGTGKTTLSNVVATEMGVTFHSIMGNKLKSWTDIYNLIKNVQENDVVFIDEIHCLTEKNQEYLYGIMEDFTYTIENKTLARPQLMKCPRFTLIGATTHTGALNGPFLSRFHHIVNLVPYTDAQLSELVIKSCYRQHQLELPVQIANTIAKLSHKTPRLANMILSNLIEVGHGTYSEKLRSSHLDKTLLEETLKMMGVDPLIGLNRAQRLYLKNLLKECTPHSYDGETMPPNCKCLGIKPLANMCKEQQNTIENFIEPPLLQEIEYVVPFKNTVQKGALVKITKHGRTPLQSAWMYMKTMENFQKKLNWFETEDFTI